MAKRGAKNKLELNPEIHTRFMQAVRLGLTVVLSCQYAGINVQTFYNWKNRVTDGTATPEIVEFFESLKEAESAAAIKWLALLNQKAQDMSENGDVKWAAWMLERRFPQQYGRHTFAHVQGLDELLRLAREKGIEASELFNAMIGQLMSIEDDAEHE